MLLKLIYLWPCAGYIMLKAKLINCKETLIHYPEKHKLKLTVQLESFQKKSEVEIQSSTNVWTSNKNKQYTLLKDKVFF